MFNQSILIEDCILPEKPYLYLPADVNGDSIPDIALITNYSEEFKNQLENKSKNNKLGIVHVKFSYDKKVSNNLQLGKRSNFLINRIGLQEVPCKIKIEN